jgi:aspartate racemase
MNKRHIGILGGLGPVASAAFLHTLYASIQVETEGDFPSVTLVADTSAPHRAAHQLATLAEFLNQKIALLENLGVTHIIVCCLLAHSLPLQGRVTRISLADLLRDEFDRSKEPKLVVGSRLLVTDRNVQEKLFGRLLSLDEILARGEQELVYAAIEAVKTNRLQETLLRDLIGMLSKYREQKLFLCCSELHAAFKDTKELSGCFDPFTAAAASLCR